MKRFSVIIAMMLAAFVGSMVAPAFAQQAPAPAAGEKKEPMKKAAKKAPAKKAPAKKADGMKKDGMKKEEPAKK